MKFSTRARYALRMMVEVARQSDGYAKVSLKRVARETNLSRRYLEQLAIGLKNASLIRGTTGKGGGYLLARSADQITVREIVEAAIGPINIVECVRQPESCLRVDCCECRPIYRQINQRIIEALKDISLADLVNGYRPQDFCAGLGSAPTLTVPRSAQCQT